MYDIETIEGRHALYVKSLELLKNPNNKNVGLCCVFMEADETGHFEKLYDDADEVYDFLKLFPEIWDQVPKASRNISRAYIWNSDMEREKVLLNAIEITKP